MSGSRMSFGVVHAGKFQSVLCKVFIYSHLFLSRKKLMNTSDRSYIPFSLYESKRVA